MGSIKFVSYRPEIMDGVQGASNRALEIIGGKAESYAKALCPVRTGRLRNSITHQQYDEETEIIGTNVEYAPHVELGTRRMAARPYLRPAAENHGEEYKQVILSELRKIQTK
jgi:HK97 gp10 family phage protein